MSDTMEACRDCLCVEEDHPVLDEIADDGSYECLSYVNPNVGQDQ